jgi:hypothetical protein
MPLTASADILIPTTESPGFSLSTGAVRPFGDDQYWHRREQFSRSGVKARSLRTDHDDEI